MKHLPIYNKAYRDLLLDYRQYLERTGYNKGSREALPSCLREFFYRMEGLGIHGLDSITSGHILDHWEYLKTRPSQRGGSLSESMVSHHLYALKTFMNYGQSSGNLNSNPFGSLSFPKPEHPPRKVLSTEEIKALYGACETLKDRAILSLFYGCGLRRSEAEKLDISDIHFKGGLLYVRSGKGGKRRVVPMGVQVTQDLKDYYLHERESYRNGSTSDSLKAFMLNNRGNRIRGGAYWKRLRYLAEQAGFMDRIGLHCLRHSIATHLLEGGLGIEQVRDFLGHRHLETTQIYTRISKQYLNEQLC
ncbi:tyrosine-type recombinase/integrase [Algoriphagus sp. NBT04N3]|jgi:integrase/recombinase XerD|uniref:tyrosine-type recombinase/integrase n=1 Tax=Algoriphagus sp. NBT04N3 TaxID=2705473 RepID=UPI001C634C5C|nr:tyrosine-type recombinase/integrase [Algoriphagus sp. NBT04N3]QYH39528.1 tyrosine-type recombinase/integrase [Algoriphagus sp. NBT04N3]QYH39534.1 tyrosine-type recombinase/integrase [Algoriphagus sp. NBT04N3]